VPPGQQKKNEGVPPGQQKKNEGVPPGQQKKSEGVPPGQQKKSASPSLTAGRKNQVAPHRTAGGGPDGHATRSLVAASGSGSHEPRPAGYPSRGSGGGHR
jgi:hypothetical protein